MRCLKGATTLIRTTFSIITFSVKGLFAAFGITTFSKLTLSITILWYYAECRFTECRYAECHYAECRFTECRYAECHYAECRFTECRYAEWRRLESSMSFIKVVHSLQFFKRDFKRENKEQKLI
jgi:hypothetical protein